MRLPRTLLQISCFESEHGYQTAYFKCTNCHNIFSLGKNTNWQFCPVCGNAGGVTYRDNLRKKVYYDNYGYWTSIDGSVVHFKPPQFTLIGEIKCGFGEEQQWERMATYPVTRDHKHLVRYVKSDSNRGYGVRFRLIPSKPLPLP